MIPNGIRYNKATRVVSSTSRKKKKIVVIDAIRMNENRYFQSCDRKEVLGMLSRLIIPLQFAPVCGSDFVYNTDCNHMSPYPLT
jgi:hypothetical protein